MNRWRKNIYGGNLIPNQPNRRDFLQKCGELSAMAAGGSLFDSSYIAKAPPAQSPVVETALNWLAGRQSTTGGWELPERYPTAMTALAGIAMLTEGSTPFAGKYASYLALATDYLLSRAQPNGLIAIAEQDSRYTYAHGFAMLFLSQIVGEEADSLQRERVKTVLEKAIQYSGESQTRYGGWGYVSALEGGNYEEGSTTVTQIQALRGCLLAGLDVPADIIRRAVIYIQRCSIKDGKAGIAYNIYGGSDRPPISAAALATLYNTDEYDQPFAQKLLKYCDSKLSDPTGDDNMLGYWHYAHYYYSQVVYRLGETAWQPYRDRLYAKLLGELGEHGYWENGLMGAHLTTSMNLTMLQLDNAALPIYQR